MSQDQVVGALSMPPEKPQGKKAKADILSFPKGEINRYFKEEAAAVADEKMKVKAAPKKKAKAEVVVEGEA